MVGSWDHLEECLFTARRDFAFSRLDEFLCRLESSSLARCNSALRDGLSPLPARLMKYVSMRMPEAGPLGDTLRDARTRAMVDESLVNNPGGGCVESVFT
jgi:hypothetical protein